MQARFIGGSVTIGLMVQNTPPPNFDVAPGTLYWAADGFHLQINGLSSGGSLIVYASTNLISWTPIYTNPPATGSLLFLDSGATNYPARFYRAVQE